MTLHSRWCNRSVFLPLIGFAFLGLLLAKSPLASAQGVLVIEAHDVHWRLPRPHSISLPAPAPNIPLLYSVQNLEIEARIRDSIAKVQMSQTFLNEGSTVVEARCIIPVPYDAIVSNVTFMVNGNEIEGKLMRAEEARSIYQSYVRRSQDPALVQWAGAGLIQTNVFPIPPGEERTVTIGYMQELRKTNGVSDWYVPLKAAGYSHQPVKKVSISAYIEDSQPLGNIYSPTHSISTTRTDGKTAKIRYQTDATSNLSDFRLLTSTSANAFAATWMSYQPQTTEDGYFMLLLHPEIDAKADASPKDILLVLDKSGSMRGAKIEQARQALLYVLEHLPPQDRVGIVVYDSQVQKFREQLVSADDKDALQSARSFVQSLTANGGTNIDQALDDALSMIQDPSRKSYIVHLSDGIATVGERDERQIVAHATKKNAHRARIFNFGVGHDVNSKMMDRLSRECFGQTFFVAPDENIEASVSGLYDRLQQPALTDIRWEMVGQATPKLNHVYPGKLYDMFAGDQATIVGRFSGKGKQNLIVTGTLAGKSMTYEQTLDLDQVRGNADGGFIASIWASRRAASIIEEIDLEGKKESLIAELIDLAKKYGIMTEYTAFLAEEPMRTRTPDEMRRETELRLGRLHQESGRDAFQQRAAKSAQSSADNVAANEASQSRFSSGAGSGAGGGGMGSGGQGLGGMPASNSLSLAPSAGGGKGLGNAAPSPTPSPQVQRSGDRAFFLEEGKWIDSQLVGKDQSKRTKIDRYSDKYFALLEKHLNVLKTLLDLDQPIIVELEGTIYEL